MRMSVRIEPDVDHWFDKKGHDKRVRKVEGLPYPFWCDYCRRPVDDVGEHKHC